MGSKLIGILAEYFNNKPWPEEWGGWAVQDSDGDIKFTYIPDAISLEEYTNSMGTLYYWSMPEDPEFSANVVWGSRFDNPSKGDHTVTTIAVDYKTAMISREEYEEYIK